MSERDRQILILGGIVAGVILLYLLVLRPFTNAVDSLDARIHERRADLVEAKQLASQIKQLRALLPQGAANVNLLSYLETLTRQANMKENIEYMKPGAGVQRGSVKRNSVELKLVKVNLKQLINLLFQIERGGKYPLIIDEIHIKKRYDTPDLMDVSLEVYQG